MYFLERKMLENKSVPSDLTGGLKMNNYNPVNYE